VLVKKWSRRLHVIFGLAAGALLLMGIVFCNSGIGGVRS